MKLNWDSIRLWSWRLFKIAVLLAIMAAGMFWYFAAVPVVQHQVESGDLVAEVMGTGTLEARLKSAISPKIAGRVREILVDQGDHVKAKQHLISLDDSDLKQQVEIETANITSAEAALDRLKADQVQAAAILEQTRRAHERAQQLIPSRVMSEEDVDLALEAYRVSQAGVARADAALVEGHTQLVVAKKNLAYRQALLDDSRIIAPFDGLVVRRYRDPGDIVVPGGPILTLVSLDEIWVSAWVDETEMSRLEVGQPAHVVFRSEPKQSYKGEVARLGREADRETREFVVDVRVVSLPQNWAVGQRAEVFIEVDRKTAVPLLPAKFVFWRDNVPGVYCRVGDRANWREITIGLQGSENIEVVEGVAVGDVVLIPSSGKNVSMENQRVMVAP